MSKKTKKAFDCVAMKNAIQARLVERRKGMSPSQVVADIEESLARSSQPISGFWRRITSSQTPHATRRAAAHR